jgi:hypothetical protein
MPITTDAKFFKRYFLMLKDTAAQAAADYTANRGGSISVLA